MTQAETTQPGRFELPLPSTPTRAVAAVEPTGGALPPPLLVRNVLWFCRLRWIVIWILLAFGAMGLVPEVIRRLGWRPHLAWPFAVAGVLTLYNVGFVWHGVRLRRPTPGGGAAANLWGQIVLDLCVLTVVVHFTGSLETYVAFAYLFHIVLACIFFPRPHSLVITVLASVLYAACVGLEVGGLVPPGGIYADGALRDSIERTAGAVTANVLFAVGIWLVVWYLASYLSALLRQRDSELAATNRQLLEAQEEKARHMLRTTHELKAPFAAIHANTHLLLKGHCGPLSDEARDVVQRIADRARRLAHEIQEMLQLANLRSVNQTSLKWGEVDLAEVLRWCIGQAGARAEERNITIDADLVPARTRGVEDHLKMLFGNLLANAVTYSHTGGRVQVTCGTGPDGRPAVTVEDHGIGIAPEKLPHIFEEYYRTDEAARHNNESSGLGLAIVRHVAQTHGIRVQVESQPGAGTTYTVVFRTAREPAGASARHHKEMQYGVSDDR